MISALRIEGGDFASISASIGQWVKRATVVIAEQEKAAAVVSDGFDVSAIVVTDGVRGKISADVKPYGRIAYVAQPNMADSVLWALAKLIEKSPVGPAEGGHYKDDHVVMINGKAIEGNLRVALSAIGPGDRVQIVNPRVYARKIEGSTASKKTGRGKRQASSKQARGGVYRVVLRALVQRYSRSMFFDYKLVKLNLGVKVWGDQGGRARGQVKRVLRDQVYPALQFFIKPTGLAD